MMVLAMGIFPGQQTLLPNPGTVLYCQECNEIVHCG
jgi:hypothetical protein